MCVLCAFVVWSVVAGYNYPLIAIANRSHSFPNPAPPSASACQAIQPTLMTAPQSRTARPTGGSHEQQPRSEWRRAPPCGCQAVLPVACKDRQAGGLHRISLLKKSLCALCLCGGIVSCKVMSHTWTNILKLCFRNAPARLRHLLDFHSHFFLKTWHALCPCFSK